MSGAAYDMPQQLREVLEDLRLGRLQLKTSDLEAPRSQDRLGRRIFAGLLIAGLVIGSSDLLTHPAQALVGYLMLGAAGLVLLVHLAGDLRR
jgi:ubiquinone biosynthesis protein